MRQTRYRVTSLFLVLGILAAAGLVGLTTLGAVTAKAEGDWGPDRAVTPTGDWDQLSAGADRWYAFEYAGDSSQIQIGLQVVPEGGAGFVVWTPEQIWRWGLGEYVEPIGRGADDPFAEGKLVWSGNFRTSGTYYVVVEHGGPGQAYYLLDISGDGVSFSKPAPTPSAQLVKAQPQVQVKKAPPGELSGKLVFQTTYGGPFYSINVDGSGLLRITNGIDPVWSPDGMQIAYVRWEEPRGVWVVNADGTGERRVFDWKDTRYPSWSPDGEQIVFSRQHRGWLEERKKCVLVEEQEICFMLPPDPHYNLGVVRVGDGSFWEPAASPTERSLSPDWSPDGEQVVYVDVPGLYVQSADGQTRYKLTDNAKDINPVWSPDGEQVAFVHRQHDHWEIYVVDADGRNFTRLTDTPALPNGTMGNSVSPAWSPDGDYIAFLTDRTGKWEIWVMQSNGRSQGPLFDTELAGLPLQYSYNGERALSWTQ